MYYYSTPPLSHTLLARNDTRMHERVMNAYGNRYTSDKLVPWLFPLLSTVLSTTASKAKLITSCQALATTFVQTPSPAQAWLVELCNFETTKRYKWRRNV